ncbi:MAG: family 43 glycosylhydrolase [Opitutaceae bacterium]|nr:family 43 glycosylhydrolase [Opitutaceae bacterium]
MGTTSWNPRDKRPAAKSERKYPASLRRLLRQGLLAGFCIAAFALPSPGTSAAEAATGSPVAPKPLYRDPVHDGAADPVVVWNPHAKRWWMFYTNRRANTPGLSGVAWVHGTKIGIAESPDGANWTPAGSAEIDLPADVGGPQPTLWAPEVVTSSDGAHHMFLTVVPGVFENWEHPRSIVHLTSPDLRKWMYVSTLKLSSDRVIDAGVTAMPGGGWRLWYNNERDNKSIYHADSRDLKTWNDRGKVSSVQGRGEGPCVFTWRGRHWMLVDTWRGLAAFRSLDLDQWAPQPKLLLDQPGRGPDDGVVGGHPGVVVSGGRAFCFYFTHPGRTGAAVDKNAVEFRRSSIQVVELFENDGWLTCDRDAPTRIALVPPDARRAPAAANPAATARAPADAAALRAFGSRDIRTHDPSTLANSKGEYWLFHTGRGVPSWRSKDLHTWTEGPPVFQTSPAWVAEAVPENRNLNFWAPDIIKVANRFFLYYSVSSFGKRTSAIALATNTTLDPADPAFGWKDEGPIVKSGSADNFNAIDPALFRDDDGRLWMAFGSYWSGLKLLELDPQTGKRISPDSPLHAIAHSRSIEAVFLHRHGSRYYLFVNHGWCCRGVNSTYHIRVGRAEKITGPYLDRDGRSLLDGGGTVFAESEGPVIGPGHASIQTIAGREWFGYHFYDATQNGRPTFGLRPLGWDADAWPVLGKVGPGD